MDKDRLAGRLDVNGTSFYFGAANENLDENCVPRLRDCCAAETFMGSVHRANTSCWTIPRTWRPNFADRPMLIATDCEDTPMIKANEEWFR